MDIPIATFFEKNKTMNMFKRASRIAVLYVLLAGLNAASAADDIQEATRMFRQGQHAQAMEKVDAYLAGRPKDAQARFLKGLILTEQGKTSEAIRVFTALTDDYPELPEPYNNLAVLYAGQGQYEKAKVALEMAIRTHPSYATAHENLGDIYAKMASQAYDRALQLDKSNTSTQTKLALIRDLFGGKGGKVTAARTVAAAPAPAAPVAPASPSEPTAAKAPVAAPVAVASAAPAKPAAKPAAAKAPANPQEDVRKAVRGWAAAWSAQDSDKYLAFYAKEFKTPGGEDRAAWEAQRRERIAKPSSIKVEALDLQVEVADDSHATASFKQTYRASHMKTSTRKVLEMVYTGGKWQIAEERAGK